jgi:DNA end-binding protein Ku
VLNRRERAVMLEPRGQGMVLWSLRYGDEVRPETEYFKGLDEEEVDRDVVAEVRKLIEARRGEWSPKLMTDPVEAELRKLIRKKARSAGAKPQKPAAGKAARTDNVIDLMAALKKSLNP